MFLDDKFKFANQDKSIEEDVDVQKAEDPILVEEKVIFNSNNVILRYFFYVLNTFGHVPNGGIQNTAILKKFWIK